MVKHRPKAHKNLFSRALKREKEDRKMRRAAANERARGHNRLLQTFMLFAPEALSIGTRLVFVSFCVKCIASVLF